MLVGGLFQIVVATDRQARPDLAELAACLNRLAAMENRGVFSTNPQYRALEVYIAGRHRDLISNSSTWSTSLFEPVASQRRALAERVVATLPSPQEADVDEAARLLRPFLDNVKPGVESGHPRVRFVSTGEAADRAGVEADDVVVAVNGELIRWASQLRDAIAKHPDQLITLSILRDGQPLMIRATPARIANQGWLGIGIGNEAPEMSLKVAWRFLWVHAIAGLMVAGTLGLLSALAVRSGIALRVMKIAVVTSSGALASGSRAQLRTVLSWLPVMAASAAAFAGHDVVTRQDPRAEGHQLGDGFSIAYAFENLRGNQGDGFRVVEFQTARFAPTSDVGGRKDQQLVDLSLGEAHAESDSRASRRRPAGSRRPGSRRSW